MKKQSKIPIYAALSANIGIGITKFIAAYFSSSSAMLSEGIHSLVDSGSELLLLLGIKRSKKAADEQHPFGYGKEIYFWTLIVSIVIFSLGGGMSIYEGISHFLYPEPIKKPVWNYIVLGTAACFEGISFIVAFRSFSAQMGNKSFWEELRLSKDPSLFAIIYEDGAALIGLVIAFVGIFCTQYFQEPRIDGIASVLIGLLLVMVSLVMVRESRNLLVGESAEIETVRAIYKLVNDDPDVYTLRQPVTMHLAPDEILLVLDVQFRRDISSQDIARIINRLENSIRLKYPEVKRIYVEARILVHQSPL